MITFSSFDEQSSPLFKCFQIVKLIDLVELQLAMFMYKFHNHLLPFTFNDLLTPVHQIHSYNTRLSAKHSYSLPKTRTNYEIFNIRYQGAKVWNELNESYKIMSISRFKQKKPKPILFIITNFS